MPNFSNKRRTRFAVRAGRALILIAFFLPLGMLPSAVADNSNPTDRISNSRLGHAFSFTTNENNEPFFQSDGAKKFFASLRFWDRDKKQQPEVRPQQPAAQASNPERPQTIQSNASSAAMPQVPNPQRTAGSGNAPVPPPNPFAPSNPNNTSLGVAPLPEQWTPNTHNQPDTADTQQNEGRAGTSFSTYSFDTRDWVDHFPQQEHISQQTGTPALIQATSYRPGTVQETPLELPREMLPLEMYRERFAVPPAANTANTAAGSIQNGQREHLENDNRQRDVPQRAVTSPPSPRNQETGQWDGQATMLATPRGAAANINLTPSYGHRLRHTQTRGVVVIQSNFPLTEIAPMLTEIEQLQHDLNRYIGVPAPKEKIELCLFKDEASYISFLKEFFPRAPRDRRALFVKLDNKPGTLLVQRSKDFEVDLRHEMTHAIIHASIPHIPIWLDEGLAKYFEVPRQDRASRHPYLAQIRWNVRLGMVSSLDRLANLETISDMGAKEYRDSWAWVHFLIHHSPATHQMLAAYLQMLADWEPDEISLPAHRMLVVVSRTKQESAPSLKRYLDDIVPNQREAFRGHFGRSER